MKTNYKIQGTPNSPVLMFSNSLGADFKMWDELIPYLLPYFRVLQYDTRGHGKKRANPKGRIPLKCLEKMSLIF